MNRRSSIFRRGAATLVLLAACATVYATPSADLTQAQAIARARSILRAKSAACRITRTQSITAVRVKAGWRVTAVIMMLASGTSRRETARWMISAARGATPQDQLTAEIGNGCP